MSSDERERDRLPHEAEIDEGLIHEWLDGQLDDATSARFEALVTTSPTFAARVAEARGFVAASSRILSALDDVPGGVLPRASAASDTPAGGAVRSMQAARDARPSTRRFTWQRLTGVAALLAVAVTGTLVLQRTPLDDTPMVASNESAAAPVEAPAPPAAAAPAAMDMAVADSAPVGAARSVAPPPRAESEPARKSAASLVPAPQVVASAGAPAPNVAVPPSAAPSQAMPAAPSAPVRSDAARAEVSRMAAGRSAAAFEMTAQPQRLAPGADEPALQGSIPSAELAFSVQRVECAPACRQLRIDLARDGRASRSVQQFGGTSSEEAGRVDASALTRLAQLADSLDLASLPPMLRLDGSRCRTVGSLRESLRVEFRRGDTLRNVMGLPWCTDGTHPLDLMARAIERAAADGIGASRP